MIFLETKVFAPTVTFVDNPVPREKEFMVFGDLISCVLSFFLHAEWIEIRFLDFFPLSSVRKSIS